MRFAIPFVQLVFILANLAAAAEPERLRVLTYNIHHGEGIDAKLDLERIAKVIRSESPDLVAIQEVDQGTRRTNQVDEPGELSKLTGMQAVFQKNIDHEGGGYGNVVLSKLPIKSQVDVKLPSLAEPEPVEQREQRGVLIAEVALQSGETVWFACTHLDCRRQDPERFESANVINEWFQRKHADSLAILAGDLNAHCDSRVVSRFSEAWTKVREEEMPTVPVKTPRRQIDFIMFRPAERWRTVEARVLDESVASDHRAYFAIVELLPPKK
jgi:endonuclease/exonuclease/phosphatase family metal-dependent hydrolase